MPRDNIGDREIIAQGHNEDSEQTRLSGAEVTDVRCVLCAVTLNDSAKYLNHLKSKKHRKNAQSAELDLLRRDWCQKRVLAHGGEEFEGADGMIVLCRFCNAHFNGRAAFITHLGLKKHKKVLKARASIWHSEEDGSPAPADGAASAKFVSNGVGEREVDLPDSSPVSAAASWTVVGSLRYGLNENTSNEDLLGDDGSWCTLCEDMLHMHFP